MDDSGDQRLKDMLDSDRELTEFLMRVSDGDCMSWLQQVSEHLEEMRETTGNSEDWLECWFACKEVGLPH